MAFAQSSYNQSSVLSINVLVVDDDPIFLQVMSRMLEKSKHRDPSVMEITVIAAKDPMEALSTLKIQRHNIDLIITDYYMPMMNGLQLKRQINKEYGNLPIMVMSSDNDKEEESLTCGAISFLPKPIKPNDLPHIYQYALACKRKGKSILESDQQNHKDTYVSIPQQIQLLPEQTNASAPQQIQLVPEQANVVKTKPKKKYSSRSDSKSGNSTDTSCVSTDGSRKNGKRKDSDGSRDDKPQPPPKKRKVKWTDELHHLFLRAIAHIGLDKAVPKKILEFMNVSYLTRENVASHLQKYRIFLRKVTEQAVFSSREFTGTELDSIFAYAHFSNPYNNYYTPSSCWYDTTLTNRSSYSKPAGYGLGQSRLLSNTRDSLRFNQTTPYNYMNRSSIYEPNRTDSSNLTFPIKSNINLSSQPSQNEGRRSFFEPPVMANKTGLTSQVFGSGQLEPAATKATSVNINMMNSYGSLSPQPGLSRYGSLAPNQLRPSNYGPNQLGPSSYGSSTSNQAGLNSYGGLFPIQAGGPSSYGVVTPTQHALMRSYDSSTLNQQELSSFGSSNPNQSELSSYGSLTSNHSGLMSSNGSSTLNLPGLRSYGNSTANQSRPNIYGSLTPYPSMNNYGSLTPNQSRLMSSDSSSTPTPTQPGLMSNYGCVTPNKSRPSHFSYGMQSFLNSESEAYKPSQPHANATTQPNTEISQLDNLNLYDDLGNISELPSETSNFQFDHNKKQGEEASTNFELPKFTAEMINQFFSIDDDDDWTFVNIDQGDSNGKTPTTFVASETNSSIFNMNPTFNSDEDVSGIFDRSILDAQDLVDDDFMKSLFNNDMN